jgi:hypothetical protein
MVVPFPVPRSELPQVHASEAEHRARKAQLQRMLESLIDEYERYTDRDLRKVDTRRWKSSTSRDRLKIYKERSSYASKHTPVDGTDDHTDRAPLDSTDSVDSVSGPIEEGADNMRMSLMIGDCTGKVENALYAVNAIDQSELAMANIFLHEDVADCALLHTMEGPTPDDPYHFLGYKWFVRKSPSHLLKHRDSVYVESIGLTKTRSGDKLGYHIMHSVDLPDFPTMRDRHCLRASQSIRTLYRQRPGNIVEVFLLGNVGPAGKLAGRLGDVFVHDMFFNMPKLVECGEAKRLTDMARDLQPLREQRLLSNRFPGESCALCRLPKKRFSGTIDACRVCGLDVCTKCRIGLRSFQSDGILGRFQKLVCCKTCLLVVANAKTHGADLAAMGEVPSLVETLPAATAPVMEQRGLDQLSASGSNAASSSSSPSVSLPQGTAHAERRQPETAMVQSATGGPEPVAHTAESAAAPPVGSGPTTVYRSQVIDISGSLALLHHQNITGPSSLPHVAEPPQLIAAASTSRPACTTTTYRGQVIDISGSLGLAEPPQLIAAAPTSRPACTTTTYRGQVIDISGSLGLADPTGSEMEPVHDEAPAGMLPSRTAVSQAFTVSHIGSPCGGSPMASATSAPPVAAPSNPQEDLYAKMLELQRKAQDAFKTAQQNKQYLVGSHTAA